MEQGYSYKLSKLTEELQTNTIYPSSDFEDVLIYTGNVHRPGLQLAGFFDHFDPNRIQLIGRMETAYMEKFTKEESREKWEALLERKIPALIVCHDAGVTAELLAAVKKFDVTLLTTEIHTTDVMSKVIGLIRREIAPRITRHGVLTEVYGIGLLLMGESGVGKSEVAIELIKRGHRLVADDAVEIKAIDIGVLQGASPPLIRHYVELRGIGVIDVRRLFGMGAVKAFQRIHLVVNLEPWRDGHEYERLGIHESKVSIMGIELPSVTIPVKPGRNLAAILEVAAMNQRQKYMGYNAAVEFTKHIDNYFSELN